MVYTPNFYKMRLLALVCECVIGLITLADPVIRQM